MYLAGLVLCFASAAVLLSPALGFPESAWALAARHSHLDEFPDFEPRGAFEDGLGLYARNAQPCSDAFSTEMHDHARRSDFAKRAETPPCRIQRGPPNHPRSAECDADTCRGTHGVECQQDKHMATPRKVCRGTGFAGVPACTGCVCRTTSQGENKRKPKRRKPNKREPPTPGTAQSRTAGRQQPGTGHSKVGGGTTPFGSNQFGQSQRLGEKRKK